MREAKIIANSIVYQLIDSFLNGVSLSDVRDEVVITEKIIEQVKTELDNMQQKLANKGIVSENIVSNIFREVLNLPTKTTSEF